MKTQKRHLIIIALAAMLGWSNVAQAHVYWKPTNGNDNNNGSTAALAVKSWSTAVAKLALQGTDQYILLCEKCNTGGATYNGYINASRNAQVKRNPGYTGIMFEGNVTFTNVTISGKALDDTYPSNCYQIVISANEGFVTVGSGAILEDNHVSIETNNVGGAIWLYYGSTFTLNGGTIRGCEARYGGAVNMSGGGTVNINSGTIENCSATTYGGAFCLGNSSFTVNMTGGTIKNCRAGTTTSGYGGGFFIGPSSSENEVKATVTLSGGSIDGCTAFYGGGIYMESSHPSVASSFTMNNTTGGAGCEIKNCLAYNTGGGLYLQRKNDACPMFNAYFTKGSINHCSANGYPAYPDGGWFGYGRAGGVNLTRVTADMNGDNMDVSYNYCRWYGGGFQLSLSTLNFSAGKIHHNTSKEGAAGLHVTATSTFNMTGGELYNNLARMNGGAAHASGNCVMNLSGGKVYNNTAYKQGGAFNLNTGCSLEIAASSTIEMYGNKAGRGGAILVDGAILTIRSGSYHDNKALGSLTGDTPPPTGSGEDTVGYFVNNNYLVTEDKGQGGAFCVTTETFNGNTMVGGCYIYGGSMCNNEASSNGGAIMMEQNTAVGENAAHGIITGQQQEMVISGGVINNNTAGGSGGAVYICDGNLTISNGDVCENSASSAGGGGIYFDATSTMTVDAGNMNVRDNTAGGVPNNIHLLSGKTIAIASTAVSPTPFKPIYVGVYTVNTTTPIPVFQGTAAQVSAIYSGMEGGTLNVYDDRQRYSPYLKSPNDGILYFNNVSPWSLLQRTARASDLGSPVDGYYQISNVKQLTAFLWKVNGISTYETTFTSPAPSIKGKLTADIDMDGHYWVPIANYTGTFDGNGHTIRHLTMAPTNAESQRGMFGTVTVSGSTNLGSVANLILRDCNFGSNSSSYLGSIACEINAGATVSNCVVHGILVANNSGCVMGGLVGRNAGTVHSSYAMPAMTGYQMGGLVGANSGNLCNSFANASFTPQTGSTAYMGGLVGVNTGRVENCYSRVQGGTAPTGNFGWLAGDNTSTADKGLYYSYTTNSTYVSGTQGNKVGLGTFTATAANAYDYKAHDNQVTASGNAFVPSNGNKQLVKALNNWVNQDASHKSTYTRWLRPTTMVINGDYPLLCMPFGNAVAETTGDSFFVYGDINTHISNYRLSTQAICFYGSKAGMNSNSGSSAPLYIDQEAVLTPSTGSKAGDIIANVGVTLDNSAGDDGGGANPTWEGGSDVIDWHFFSSVLTNAAIGLYYPYAETSVPYGTAPTIATFTSSSQYFSESFNSYYSDWDLYSYYEPDYHWINLKRNSHSHWHEDANYLGEHAWIDYPNDTRFEPGHGYMVALAEENYLQAYGTLNTHSESAPLEVSIDYTPDISWTTREGQNLLGNPYQSYLDFNAFATANSDLWGSGTTPFYIVMDEDQADYVIYAKTASYNADAQASRYIHPHQGFMIKAGKSGKKAKFHDGMRTTTMESSWTSDFRGESQPDYPLVNLFVKDENGNRDIVTVELGRPEKGGVPKSQVPGTSTGRISCHYEGENYALAFTEPGLDAANIRFTTDEDCAYTMTWNTQNGEFSYLHLIDNMIGTDIDCLTTEEYRFDSKTSDYASRFRLVFGYTGIEEPEGDGPSASSEDSAFAFQMGDELVVNGEGVLQLVDLNGRIMDSQTLHGTQNTVSLPNVAAGVYVLRLKDQKGTKVQKMVIR